MSAETRPHVGAEWCRCSRCLSYKKCETCARGLCCSCGLLVPPVPCRCYEGVSCAPPPKGPKMLFQGELFHFAQLAAAEHRDDRLAKAYEGEP